MRQPPVISGTDSHQGPVVVESGGVRKDWTVPWVVPSALPAKARKKYLVSGWSPAKGSSVEKFESERAVPFQVVGLDRRELCPRWKP